MSHSPTDCTSPAAYPIHSAIVAPPPPPHVPHQHQHHPAHCSPTAANVPQCIGGQQQTEPVEVAPFPSDAVTPTSGGHNANGDGGLHSQHPHGMAFPFPRPPPLMLGHSDATCSDATCSDDSNFHFTSAGPHQQPSNDTANQQVMQTEVVPAMAIGTVSTAPCAIVGVPRVSPTVSMPLVEPPAIIPPSHFAHAPAARSLAVPPQRAVAASPVMEDDREAIENDTDDDNCGDDAVVVPSSQHQPQPAVGDHYVHGELAANTFPLPQPQHHQHAATFPPPQVVTAAPRPPPAVISANSIYALGADDGDDNDNGNDTAARVEVDPIPSVTVPLSLCPQQQQQQIVVSNVVQNADDLRHNAAPQQQHAVDGVSGSVGHASAVATGHQRAPQIPPMNVPPLPPQPSAHSPLSARTPDLADVPPHVQDGHRQRNSQADGCAPLMFAATTQAPPYGCPPPRQCGEIARVGEPFSAPPVALPSAASCYTLVAQPGGGGEGEEEHRGGGVFAPSSQNVQNAPYSYYSAEAPQSSENLTGVPSGFVPNVPQQAEEEQHYQHDGCQQQQSGQHASGLDDSNSGLVQTPRGAVAAGAHPPHLSPPTAIAPPSPQQQSLLTTTNQLNNLSSHDCERNNFEGQQSDDQHYHPAAAPTLCTAPHHSPSGYSSSVSLPAQPAITEVATPPPARSVAVAPPQSPATTTAALPTAPPMPPTTVLPAAATVAVAPPPSAASITSAFAATMGQLLNGNRGSLSNACLKLLKEAGTLFYHNNAVGSSCARMRSGGSAAGGGASGTASLRLSSYICPLPSFPSSSSAFSSSSSVSFSCDSFEALHEHIRLVIQALEDRLPLYCEEWRKNASDNDNNSGVSRSRGAHQSNGGGGKAVVALHSPPSHSNPSSASSSSSTMHFILLPDMLAMAANLAQFVGGDGIIGLVKATLRRRLAEGEEGGGAEQQHHHQQQTVHVSSMASIEAEIRIELDDIVETGKMLWNRLAVLFQRHQLSRTKGMDGGGEPAANDGAATTADKKKSKNSTPLALTIERLLERGVGLEQQQQSQNLHSNHHHAIYAATRAIMRSLAVAMITLKEDGGGNHNNNDDDDTARDDAAGAHSTEICPSPSSHSHRPAASLTPLPVATERLLLFIRTGKSFLDAIEESTTLGMPSAGSSRSPPSSSSSPPAQPIDSFLLGSAMSWLRSCNHYLEANPHIVVTAAASPSSSSSGGSAPSLQAERASSALHELVSCYCVLLLATSAAAAAAAATSPSPSSSAKATRQCNAAPSSSHVVPPSPSPSLPSAVALFAIAKDTVERIALYIRLLGCVGIAAAVQQRHHAGGAASLPAVAAAALPPSAVSAFSTFIDTFMAVVKDTALDCHLAASNNSRDSNAADGGHRQQMGRRSAGVKASRDDGGDAPFWDAEEGGADGASPSHDGAPSTCVLPDILSMDCSGSALVVGGCSPNSAAVAVRLFLERAANTAETLVAMLNTTNDVVVDPLTANNNNTSTVANASSSFMSPTHGPLSATSSALVRVIAASTVASLALTYPSSSSSKAELLAKASDHLSDPSFEALCDGYCATAPPPSSNVSDALPTAAVVLRNPFAAHLLLRAAVLTIAVHCHQSSSSSNSSSTVPPAVMTPTAARGEFANAQQQQQHLDTALGFYRGVLLQLAHPKQGVFAMLTPQPSAPPPIPHNNKSVTMNSSNKAAQQPPVAVAVGVMAPSAVPYITAACRIILQAHIAGNAKQSSSPLPLDSFWSVFSEALTLVATGNTNNGNGNGGDGDEDPFIQVLFAAVQSIFNVASSTPSAQLSIPLLTDVMERCTHVLGHELGLADPNQQQRPLTHQQRHVLLATPPPTEVVANSAAHRHRHHHHLRSFLLWSVDLAQRAMQMLNCNTVSSSHEDEDDEEGRASDDVGEEGGVVNREEGRNSVRRACLEATLSMWRLVVSAASPSSSSSSSSSPSSSVLEPPEYQQACTMLGRTCAALLQTYSYPSSSSSASSGKRNSSAIYCGSDRMQANRPSSARSVAEVSLLFTHALGCVISAGGGGVGSPPSPTRNNVQVDGLASTICELMQAAIRCSNNNDNTTDPTTQKASLDAVCQQLTLIFGGAAAGGINNKYNQTPAAPHHHGHPSDGLSTATNALVAFDLMTSYWGYLVAAAGATADSSAATDVKNARSAAGIGPLQQQATDGGAGVVGFHWGQQQQAQHHHQPSSSPSASDGNHHTSRQHQQHSRYKNSGDVFIVEQMVSAVIGGCIGPMDAPINSTADAADNDDEGACASVTNNTNRSTMLHLIACIARRSCLHSVCVKVTHRYLQQSLAILKRRIVAVTSSSSSLSDASSSVENGPHSPATVSALLEAALKCQEEAFTAAVGAAPNRMRSSAITNNASGVGAVPPTTTMTVSVALSTLLAIFHEGLQCVDLACEYEALVASLLLTADNAPPSASGDAYDGGEEEGRASRAVAAINRIEGRDHGQQRCAVNIEKGMAIKKKREADWAQYRTYWVSRLCSCVSDWLLMAASDASSPSSSPAIDANPNPKRSGDHKSRKGKPMPPSATMSAANPLFEHPCFIPTVVAMLVHAKGALLGKALRGMKAAAEGGEMVPSETNRTTAAADGNSSNSAIPLHYFTNPSRSAVQSAYHCAASAAAGDRDDDDGAHHSNSVAAHPSNTIAPLSRAVTMLLTQIILGCVEHEHNMANLNDGCSSTCGNNKNSSALSHQQSALFFSAAPSSACGAPTNPPSSTLGAARAIARTVLDIVRREAIEESTLGANSNSSSSCATRRELLLSEAVCLILLASSSCARSGSERLPTTTATTSGTTVNYRADFVRVVNSIRSLPPSRGGGASPTAAPISSPADDLVAIASLARAVAEAPFVPSASAAGGDDASLCDFVETIPFEHMALSAANEDAFNSLWTAVMHTNKDTQENQHRRHDHASPSSSSAASENASSATLINNLCWEFKLCDTRDDQLPVATRLAWVSLYRLNEKGNSATPPPCHQQKEEVEGLYGIVDVNGAKGPSSSSSLSSPSDIAAIQRYLAVECFNNAVTFAHFEGLPQSRYAPHHHNNTNNHNQYNQRPNAAVLSHNAADLEVLRQSILSELPHSTTTTTNGSSSSSSSSLQGSFITRCLEQLWGTLQERGALQQMLLLLGRQGHSGAATNRLGGESAGGHPDSDGPIPTSLNHFLHQCYLDIISHSIAAALGEGSRRNRRWMAPMLPDIGNAGASPFAHIPIAAMSPNNNFARWLLLSDMMTFAITCSSSSLSASSSSPAVTTSMFSLSSSAASDDVCEMISTQREIMMATLLGA